MVGGLLRPETRAVFENASQGLKRMTQAAHGLA